MPLALYGRGNLGKLAQEYFKNVLGVVPLCFERNEEIDRETCVAVSIVSQPYVPIERDLYARGYKAVVPFYDLTEFFKEKHPLSNGWFAPALTLADRKAIKLVVRRFTDNTSRAHYLQFFAWRKARQEWSFTEAPLAQRYFIPEVVSVLHDYEVFVDGGAHHGTVIQSFIEHCKRGRKIIAIEPDTFNRATLKANFAKDKRITILSCALAEHEGIANFHGWLGYASQLSTTGHDYVITYPLDALKLKPTFLKLHLEGGELAALKGARHTLLVHRPIVAVTVYHNDDGLWKTPLWLMEHLTDYRFLFRCDGWCGTGAIMYAIPNERIPRESPA